MDKNNDEPIPVLTIEGTCPWKDCGVKIKNVARGDDGNARVKAMDCPSCGRKILAALPPSP